MLGDTRWNNSHLVHQQPARSAARRTSPPTPTRSTPARSNGHNLGLSVSYITGPFAVTLASPRGSSNSAQPLPAGFERQTVLQAGRDLRLPVRARSTARSAGSRPRRPIDVAAPRSFQLGAAVPVGTGADPGRLRPPARRPTPSKATTDRTASIGYDYFLSKSTDIYVAAMYEKLSFALVGQQHRRRRAACGSRRRLSRGSPRRAPRRRGRRGAAAPAACPAARARPTRRRRGRR